MTKRPARKMTVRTVKKGSIFAGKMAYSLAVILLNAIVLFAATFAWFSMNREVDGSGMTMSVDTTPNLIICKELDENNKVPANSGFSVSFAPAQNADPILLSPATHQASVDVGDTLGEGEPTGLIYCNNPDAVSRSTGYKAGTTDLELLPVPVYSSGIRYYIDYTVYIASLNKTLDYSSLVATFTPDPFDSNEHNYAYKAASVDYYLDDVYMGTSNYVDYEENSSAKTIVLATNGTVPQNTTGKLKITLRCYFDGALEIGNTGSAYVTSDVLIDKTAEIDFGVHIEAVEPTA